MDDIYYLAYMLNELKKEAFLTIKKNVDYIINNNIQDRYCIEDLLDNLINYIYDDESLNYYLCLCKYYKKIDREGSNFYLKLLSEEELI